MQVRISCFLIFIFLALSATPPPIAADPAADPVDELRRDLSAVFTGRQMAEAQWGVAVYSIDREESLFEHNARKLYIPASNEKIVTAAAALLRLGPEYRFKTNVLAEGAISDGVLRGRLIVQGFGDPSASLRIGNHIGNNDPFAVFRDWAARLKSQGVRAIIGGLAGDASCFAGPGYGRGWEWDDLIESYAAPVSALQFNENFVSLDIRPGAKSSDAAVTVQKPLPNYLRLDGSVATRTAAEKITIERAADGTAVSPALSPVGEAVRIGGVLSLKSSTVNRLVAVQYPVRYYLEAFKHLLGQEGIDVTGCAVEEVAAPSGASGKTTARLLWTHESAPLGELLVPMMKESLNLSAETVLRTLGREVRGAGTDTAGIEVVEEVLGEMGIPKGSYIYADASGLSRRNLVSADILVKVLGFMHRQPSFPRFYSSLAVAGTDGTLKGRLKKTAAEGNIRAKTGTMSGVSAISGYVKTADGETLAFSMIANNYPFPKAAAEAAQNRALVRLAAFSR